MTVLVTQTASLRNSVESKTAAIMLIRKSMFNPSKLVEKSILILTAVLSTIAAPHAHGLGETPGLLCASLFRASGVSRVEQWPIARVTKPAIDESPLLDRPSLKQIFEGVFDAGSAGRAALTYMKRLPPDMPGATKAKLWIELVRHINNIEIIIFSSDMFTLPGGRYLFRGGAGESLFIESDGTMYRTRTVPLDRAATWEADYLQFTRIN